MNEDKRLIEDYLPIQAISKEASREKSVRKGHISTLHLWWARRPLVACRAAVYGALVPAARFIPENGPDNKKQSLGRANAAKFVKRLCRYPKDSNPEEKADIERVVKEAQRHILEAHAERLTQEMGKEVTVADIEEGRAPRPKVLDMFAGGGAIPLEALRLGCEAYALDLNPVAHIIELCTLVYPQKYGKPDVNSGGMTGPKNTKGETTWGGLADEVRYWGEWVLRKAKSEIADLYPLIPDPEYREKRPAAQAEMWKPTETESIPPGYLMPVAYLWTRTVRCKNPECGSTVPLVKQTWLCKKKGRYVALKIVAPKEQKKVRFELVEATTEKDLGFDPSVGSKGGNAICPFCGTVADRDYVKTEGPGGRVSSNQMMAIVCTQPGKGGRVYLTVEQTSSLLDNATKMAMPPEDEIRKRISDLCELTGQTVPVEPIEANPRSMDTQHFGFKTWGDLFIPRQMMCLLSFAAKVGEAESMILECSSPDISKAIASYLALTIDRLADWNSSLCSWCPENTGGAKIGHTFGRQALPMVWDFVESGVWGDATGSFAKCLDWVAKGVSESQTESQYSANVTRGSATSLPWPDASFDAVITDPPYYDNVSYSNLSDFFYIWLKRTIGYLYPEHFSVETTPKKKEIIVASYRHDGSKARARRAYEQMMAQAFAEANRVLKSGGQMTVVYAHKTTLGWSTLVDALRRADFTVTEAWPLDTEMKARLVAMESAALASSIFLVARKRESSFTASYEDEVRPELERIVHERVDSLWKMGITGADLVIAAVGAGLRAFTRFARVEFANGEEVPAEKFLAEVEGAVLETILRRLSREVGGNGSQVSLEGLDPATRFYVLWRYTYKYSVLDAGEAIIFANGTHVELDGPDGLTTGSRALLEKQKGKYKLLDFSDRGDDKKLGMMKENGQSAPLIDALHRSLWLMDNRPGELPSFLQEAQPNREQMRLVAQVLAGPALKGGELADVSPHAELSALGKLTANWRSVIEDSGLSLAQKKAKDRGQDRLF
jgi:putative DNA methylase